MYFSVISPVENQLRQATHELAQSIYEEHQWLWKFFPNKPDQQRDFIFRRQDVDNNPRFYIVSKREPVSFSSSWRVQTRSYSPSLMEGQRLSFQLRVNPVVTKKNVNGKSQRHDVVMHTKKQLLKEQGLDINAKRQDWHSDDKPLLPDLAQQTYVDWLNTRAETNGFQIIQVNVDSNLQNKAGKRDIQFSTVDFSGELYVTDPLLFQHVLLNGLGHAKAFGCGLMLVKRADS